MCLTLRERILFVRMVPRNPSHRAAAGIEPLVLPCLSSDLMWLAILLSRLMLKYLRLRGPRDPLVFFIARTSQSFLLPSKLDGRGSASQLNAAEMSVVYEPTLWEAHAPEDTLLSMKVEKAPKEMGRDRGILDMRRAAALM